MKVAKESSNFLQQKHTLQHFRSEYFVPSLANRASRFQWEGKGSKSIVEVAREKVKKILAEHEPPSLDENVKKQLQNILKTATKNVAT
jgi:trimethylamine:corrinoid methyltransferase-like protein